MSIPQDLELFFDRVTNRLYYYREISVHNVRGYYRQGDLYDARTLRHIDREWDSTLLEVLNLDDNVTGSEEFISDPVFVRTRNGFTVFTSIDDELDYIQSFDPVTTVALNSNPFGSENDPIITVIPFLFPERIIPSEEVQRLPRMDLPHFSQIWLESLNELQRTGMSLNSVHSKPQEGINEIGRSYQTLVGQIYNLPVMLPEFLIINDLHVDFIPFNLVSTLQIDRFDINPLLQPWAGPPTTLNRIITLILKDGRLLLVKARFDSTTNQIYSPI